MPDLNEVETRLTAMFGHVARQVPDRPPATGHLSSLQLALARGPEVDDEVESEPGSLDPGSPSHRSWRRRAAVVGLVVVAGLAGAAGVAAATGELSPSATTQLAQQALTPAISIVGSSDPASVPGAVSRLSTPGPDGTVLKVYSDNGRNSRLAAANCIALTINTPTGTPAPGAQGTDSGSCTVMGVSSLSDQLPAPDQDLGYAGSQDSAKWVSPSGATYQVYYGDGVAGTASVKLVNADGQVGATEVADQGWYAIYALSNPSSAYTTLEFQSSDGAVLSTSQMGASS